MRLARKIFLFFSFFYFYGNSDITSDLPSGFLQVLLFLVSALYKVLCIYTLHNFEKNPNSINIFFHLCNIINRMHTVGCI